MVCGVLAVLPYLQDRLRIGAKVEKLDPVKQGFAMRVECLHSRKLGLLSVWPASAVLGCLHVRSRCIADGLVDCSVAGQIR